MGGGYEVEFALKPTYRGVANDQRATPSPPSQRELHARRVWRDADAVCFDVDSTVCTDEAIDELAKFLGVGEQVARCTQQAMGGKMSFREALQAR